MTKKNVQNSKNKNCPGCQLSRVVVVKGGRCPGWQLSRVADVQGGSCPGWQLSIMPLRVKKTRLKKLTSTGVSRHNSERIQGPIQAPRYDSDMMFEGGFRWSYMMPKNARLSNSSTDLLDAKIQMARKPGKIQKESPVNGTEEGER